MFWAVLQKRLSPFILLSVIFSMIYFFISNVDDPTQKNINNNNAFNIESAYLTTSPELSITDILTTSSQFIPSKIKNIPWNFKQHAYWLKIIINSYDAETVNLVSHFDNVMLDELSIFQLNVAGKVIKQSTLGDLQQELAFKQRITPHFNFSINAFDKTTLYVRIVTTGIANTPINIYQNRDFFTLIEKTHLLWGVFIGVSVIMGLYNLVLYYAIKESIYLFYNAYILSFVTLLGVVLGYGFYLFPEALQLKFHQQVIALNCLVVIFSLLFLLYFLKFQRNKQWHYWLVMSAVLTLSLLLFSSLWLPEYIGAQLYFMLLPVAYMICILLIMIKLREGLTWEKFYIYSWFPLLIGATIQPLVLTGKIPYNFLSHHTLMIAILIEIVLMAMALADRMRFQRKTILHNATHDISSGLPNMTLLERNISHYLATNHAFASCLIDITNYHSLVPYMAHNKLQQLERQVIADITPLLNKENKITVLSTVNNNNIKVAKINDGHLMFICETSDQLFLTQFLKKVQGSIGKTLQLEGLLIELKIKIGICFSVKVSVEHNAHEFIQNALLAIEQDKGSENKLHYYHDLTVLNIKNHLTLACDLQKAIREDQLALYHQPQIDLKSGHIYGSEVLLRWLHPEHGFISPELFVGIAEDTGLINELTRWVIDRAFQQLLSLREYHYLPHKIAINISAKDITLPNFFSYVEEKMIAFSIPRDIVIFELTESVMVSDFKVLNRLMLSLKKIGIQLSIDDYGTGYSSLTYISQLKFDELKIDKAFILDLDSSSRNLTIVKTTIDMAKNLQLKVVAEGVESQLIEQKLKENGCDISQGYYYTAPLPFDEYVLWIEHYNHTHHFTPLSLS